MFHLPRGPPNPGIEPVSPALAGRLFTTESPGKPLESIWKDSGKCLESVPATHTLPSLAGSHSLSLGQCSLQTRLWGSPGPTFLCKSPGTDTCFWMLLYQKTTTLAG